MHRLAAHRIQTAVTVSFATLEEDLDGPHNLFLLANDVTYRRLRIAMENLKKRATGIQSFSPSMFGQN
jgi:hypothetical protein